VRVLVFGKESATHASSKHYQDIMILSPNGENISLSCISGIRCKHWYNVLAGFFKSIVGIGNLAKIFDTWFFIEVPQKDRFGISSLDKYSSQCNSVKVTAVFLKTIYSIDTDKKQL
jgi:hypothetical protein